MRKRGDIEMNVAKLGVLVAPVGKECSVIGGKIISIETAGTMSFEENRSSGTFIEKRSEEISRITSHGVGLLDVCEGQE